MLLVRHVTGLLVDSANKRELWAVWGMVIGFKERRILCWWGEIMSESRHRAWTSSPYSSRYLAVSTLLVCRPVSQAFTVFSPALLFCNQVLTYSSAIPDMSESVSCKSTQTDPCQLTIWMPTVSHIVNICILTKSEGGFRSLHNVGDDALHCLETTVTTALVKWHKMTMKMVFSLSGCLQILASHTCKLQFIVKITCEWKP